MAVTEVFFLNPSDGPHARVQVRRGRAPSSRQTTRRKTGEANTMKKKAHKKAARKPAHKKASSSYRKKAKRNGPAAAAPATQRKSNKAGSSRSGKKPGPKKGAAAAAAVLAAAADQSTSASKSRSRSRSGSRSRSRSEKSKSTHTAFGLKVTDNRRYSAAKKRIAKLSAELKQLRSAGKGRMGSAAFARAERHLLQAYKKAKDAQNYAFRRMIAAERSQAAMSKYKKGSKAYARSKKASVRNLSRAQMSQLSKLSDAYGISKINPADDASRLATLLPQAGAMVVSLGGIGVLAKMLGDKIAANSDNATLRQYAGVGVSALGTVAAYMAAQRVPALRPFSAAIFFGGLAATAIHALSAITMPAPTDNSALSAKGTTQGGVVTLGQRLGLPIGPMNGLFGTPGEGIGGYHHRLNGYVAMGGYVGIPQRAQPVNGYVAMNGYNAANESISPNTLILGDGRQTGADLRASGALDGNPFGGSLSGNSLQARR